MSANILNKKRVLIVEDDQSISQVLKMLLEDQGYRVAIENTAENIDIAIINFAPHIILLDLWLPRVDGSMVLSHLKSDKNLQKIPVVLISAAYDAYQTAYKFKADGFLSKPFDIDDVLAYINQLTFSES